MPGHSSLRYQRRAGAIYAYDQDVRKAQAFAVSMTGEHGITIEATADLRNASECAIIVTCTTARRFFLLREMVSPETSSRSRDDEITIFDSTGTGLKDVAAAIATYRQALDAQAGTRFTFS